MTQWEQVVASLTQSIQSAWAVVMQWLPRLVGALLIFIITWIAAAVVRAMVRRPLTAIKLDERLEGSTLARLIGRFAEGATLSSILVRVMSALVWIIGWMTAFEVLGLETLRGALLSVVEYLPRLIHAVAVVAFGAYLAGIVGRSVRAATHHTGAGELLRRVVETILICVAGFLAVEALGFDLSILSANVTLLVALIGGTLAFLACFSMREPAREIIATYYVRRLLDPGDAVETPEAKGTVEKISPLGVVLRDDAGKLHLVKSDTLLGALSWTPTADPER